MTRCHSYTYGIKGTKWTAHGSKLSTLPKAKAVQCTEYFQPASAKIDLISEWWVGGGWGSVGVNVKAKQVSRLLQLHLFYLAGSISRKYNPTNQPVQGNEVCSRCM